MYYLSIRIFEKTETIYKKIILASGEHAGRVNVVCRTLRICILYRSFRSARALVVNFEYGAAHSIDSVFSLLPLTLFLKASVMDYRR